MPDNVNHPKHYNAHPSGIECIQVVRHMGFNVGNAIKYLWRADEKGNALEDLKKAAWYIADEIAKRQEVTPAPAAQPDYFIPPCTCTYFGWGIDIDIENVFTCKKCGQQYRWNNNPGNYGWFAIPAPAAPPDPPTPVPSDPEQMRERLAMNTAVQMELTQRLLGIGQCPPLAGSGTPPTQPTPPPLTTT